MTDPGFDPVAANYDALFTHSALGQLQRALVHRALKPLLRPDTEVLELNSGTGADALWLAERGCRVLATDLSANMVARTAEKIRRAGLEHRVSTRPLDLRALPKEPLPGAGFDLIFSNFGGLNCLSPTELQALGAALPRLLRPGGRLALVVMGRFCAWETAYFLLKGQWAAARRRWNGGPVQARLDARTSIPTWYYGPGELARFFPGLGVRRLAPVGFWAPPSYLETWFGRRPGLLRGLAFLEI
ncbi:MAG: class I SAM-dependent methyltransferase [Saprospiraceae bacterium]|nr:class I SAM-dependent methyltransferase [Saprospiraceae bacterium]